MIELTPDRFAEFFEAVRGFEPFEWQQDLVDRLAAEQFPELIDVPTGLGKTSVIDAWAFTLALQDPKARSIPLRVLFVVDRRIIVDATYEAAEQLLTALLSPASKLVATVAKRLQSYTNDNPIEVRKMRGGSTWDARWLRRPDSPAIVTSTVDQFGSRLLFRGYGVSPGMRPINAALVGTDSWVILDEAHISEPLAATVGRVVRHQTGGLLAKRTMRFTRMSATAQASESTLSADLDREMTSSRFPRSASRARSRLRADKPAGLIDLGWLGSGRKRRESTEQLGAALGKIVHGIVRDGQAAAVVCNSIGAARAAFKYLQSTSIESVLLTGRCRAFERDEIVSKELEPFKLGASRDPSVSRVIVATQTIEVGANLDFDFMVTECAPFSSIVQRFGRVNRLGERRPATSYIVHADFNDDDPIYGDGNRRTWDWLVGLGGEPARFGSPKEIGKISPETTLDLGILKVLPLLLDAGADLRTPPPFTPVALVPHFERWSQSNPAPFPDQPVAPFLHGDGRNTPDVSVAWRAIPASADPSTWAELVDLVRPVDWEFVDVPIWELRGLLAGVPPSQPTPDIEGVNVSLEEPAEAVKPERFGLIYRGPSQPADPVSAPADVKPGDRVVLRSDIGGHDRWGWTGLQSSGPVADVADLAPLRSGEVIRLDPEIVMSWGKDPSPLIAAISELSVDDPETIEKAIALMPYATLPQGQRWRAYPGRSGLEGPTTTWLLDQREYAPRSEQGLLDAASDEDEITTSHIGRRLTLDQHGEEVGDKAREFASNMGLPEDIARAVEIAGRLHDLGKADPRFQISLYLGDELAASGGNLIAKSGIDPRHPRARSATRSSGLPRGFRHEARSEQLAKELLEDSQGSLDRDLILHLIASHHGWSRPIMRPVADPNSPRIAFEQAGEHIDCGPLVSQVDWSHPTRFRVLNDRYGHWALAYLETIVRLADMYCSEVAS
ncbi:MAG: type I-G CRISPR-associated helicase/endonuclease Cas3g [Acidimicrobiia bacterium]